MHILLINVNPVVSRLLVLCTRDESLNLDEVMNVDDIQETKYDVIFVDESSYDNHISNFLLAYPTSKKVFISYTGSEMEGFDLAIKKPFLPSQIMDIIEAEMHSEKPISNEIEEESNEPFIFPLSTEEENTTILDVSEIEKIKALLDMDDEVEDIDTEFNENEMQRRKVELIKQQLIADGLEIVDENEIVDELNIDFEDSTIISKKSKKKKKKSKKLKFTEKNMERIEDAVEMAMANMTKKQMKQLLKGKEIEMKIMLKGKN